MITETLQSLLFIWISAAFIICLVVSVWRFVREGIVTKLVHEPVRHEAVIIPFHPRSQRGRVNV